MWCSLKLPMPVRVEHWFKDQSVCVVRGPLVYSLKIAAERVEHTNDPDNIKVFLAGHDIRGFPEVEFYPESDWHYGFNAKSTSDAQIKVVESAMPDNPFVADQTPVHLEVPLYQLPDWSPEAVDAGEVTKSSSAASEPTTMTMLPYGATYLRLTTLPVVRDKF